MTPIPRPRRDHVITDDGPETRAYRVATTDDSLDGHDRRTPHRRERIRRALDRMQATPAEVSLIAAGDRRNYDRRTLGRMQVTPAEVSRIAAAN
jgi:transcriptional regulator GlxA family with amidase domain